MQRAAYVVHCCQETLKKFILWGCVRTAAPCTRWCTFIYLFQLAAFFFLFLEFLLGISAVFTSVMASSQFLSVSNLM